MIRDITTLEYLSQLCKNYYSTTYNLLLTCFFLHLKFYDDMTYYGANTDRQLFGE